VDWYGIHVYYHDQDTDALILDGVLVRARPASERIVGVR
jgi:hypothetical protein